MLTPNTGVGKPCWLGTLFTGICVSQFAPFSRITRLGRDFGQSHSPVAKVRMPQAD